jgi:hypothetical protein
VRYRISKKDAVIAASIIIFKLNNMEERQPMKMDTK